MDHDMAVDFVNRFRTAAMHCNAPKIMMVEDDVHCHRVSTRYPRYDGSGLAWSNTPLSDEFFQFVKNKTGVLPYIPPEFQYGLCGGAIYSTEVMRKLRVTKEELNLWASFDNRIGVASDTLFTAILLVNNYTVGVWDDLMQAGNSIKDAAFQHSVKTWYGVPLDDHEKKWFEPDE
eukprot:gene34998-45301_t